MPEIGPSGSMSGEWKRSLSHRATPRLYSGSLMIRAAGPLAPSNSQGSDLLDGMFLIALVAASPLQAPWFAQPGPGITRSRSIRSRIAAYHEHSTATSGAE